MWSVNFWLIQAPIKAVYEKRKMPEPIPSDPPPEKPPGVALEPYEIPLPPMPVPDPGESMAQKKTRLLAYGQAANYYLIYTLVSFICLCGGPGLHFLLTLFGDHTPDPCFGVQPLPLCCCHQSHLPMLYPIVTPCVLCTHTAPICIASFAVPT